MPALRKQEKALRQDDQAENGMGWKNSSFHRDNCNRKGGRAKRVGPFCCVGPFCRNGPLRAESPEDFEFARWAEHNGSARQAERVGPFCQNGPLRAESPEDFEFAR